MAVQCEAALSFDLLRGFRRGGFRGHLGLASFWQKYSNRDPAGGANISWRRRRACL